MSVHRYLPRELQTRTKRVANAGAPKSFDAKARTVDVIMSMGSPVQRAFGTEKLRIAASAVDLSRLSSVGIPTLDSHNQGGMESVVGKVVRPWFEGSTLYGRIKFSQSPKGKLAMDMVRRGEIGGVSVGYLVHRWEIRSEDGRLIDPETDYIPLDGSATFEATRWELLELSLVSVAADAQATIRSLGFTTEPRIGIRGARNTRVRMRMRARMARRGIPTY